MFFASNKELILRNNTFEHIPVRTIISIIYIFCMCVYHGEQHFSVVPRRSRTGERLGRDIIKSETVTVPSIPTA